MAEPGTVLPVCERLLHMVNTHHAIKDCAAMQEAADTIEALYEAVLGLLGQIEQGHMAFMVEQSPSVAAATSEAKAVLAQARGDLSTPNSHLEK